MTQHKHMSVLSQYGSGAHGVGQLSPLVAQLGERVAQHLQPEVDAREDALRVDAPACL